MYIIENDRIGLMQYTHEDDYDMYLCWQDMATQKGYNYIFDVPFSEFQKTDIEQFRFWVVVVNKATNSRVGVLRLGLDEECPDLAIWIYPRYRNNGYGKESFHLALKYIFAAFDYREISAGCYADNTYSLKMLSSLGFVRYPEGDQKEKHCFSGRETIQFSFKIRQDILKQ